MNGVCYQESDMAAIDEVNALKVAESNNEEQNLGEIKEEKKEANNKKKEKEANNKKEEKEKKVEKVEDPTEKLPVVITPPFTNIKAEEKQKQAGPKAVRPSAVAPGFTPMKQIGVDEFHFNLYNNHNTYSVGTLMSHVSNTNWNPATYVSSQGQPLTYVAATPLTVFAHSDQYACSTKPLCSTQTSFFNPKSLYTSRASCTSNSQRIKRNSGKTNRILLARHQTLV